VEYSVKGFHNNLFTPCLGNEARLPNLIMGYLGRNYGLVLSDRGSIPLISTRKSEC